MGPRVKFTTRRSIETGPNTDVAVVVKNSLAALSGSHRLEEGAQEAAHQKPGDEHAEVEAWPVRSARHQRLRSTTYVMLARSASRAARRRQRVQLRVGLLGQTQSARPRA